MKILHIINSLKKGGAEGCLYRLSKFHKKKYKRKINIIIVTLIDKGFYETDLKKIGIKIFSLGINKKTKFFDIIKKIFKLRKYIKNQNPEVIQSWMYHSNYITLLLPRIFYDKIFWNIRHSELNIRFSKKMTILISIICGILSRIIPKKIIYCSEKSIKFHEKQHFYSKNKTALINNGFSDKIYFSSRYLRSNFRKKNKIKKNDIILGFAGRYAKQKNINSLLLAFSKIIKNFDNVYLYMAGKDMGAQNKELVDNVTSLKLQNRVFFLNEQKKLVEFYNGIDLLLLTSHSESFPNVVAEAMLCSTPVLSSDAGCAKKIINKYGFIMSHNNSETIVHNLKKTLNLFKNKKTKWKSLKIKSQNHIKKNYSIENMANSYLKEWVLN